MASTASLNSQRTGTSPHAPKQEAFGAWLWVPVMVVLLVNAPQLAFPVGYNEAMFIEMGRGLFDGRLPYRDLFDQKPPLIYAWYGVIELIAGPGLLWSRTTIVAALGATAVLVALTARELYRTPVAGAIAGVSFGLATAQISVSREAQLDQLALLPLAGSIYSVFCRPPVSNRRLMVGGLAAGLAVMLKPTVVPFAVVLAVFVWERTRSLRSAAIFSGSGLSILVITIGWLAAAGILHEAYDATVVFGLEYSSVEVEDGRINNGLMFWGIALAPLAVLSAAGLVILVRQRATALIPILGLLLAGGLAVVLPGRYLLYYATLLLPTLSLCVPPAFSWLRHGGPWVRIPAAAVLAFCCYIAVVAGDYFVPRFDLPQGSTLGSAIRGAARPEDRLWVHSNQPQIYYYSGVLPAHRYFTPQALAAREGADQQTLRDLEANPPRFIVSDVERYFPGLLEFLTANYDVLATEDDLIAFVRRSDG